MEPDPVKSAYAQRQERPFVLETAELALNSPTPSVELARARRVARDERVQTVGFDPRRSGLALPGRAAPLRRAASVIGPSERPLAVPAHRRLVLAAHDTRGATQRDDGDHAPVHAAVMDRVRVVALVHRARLDREAASARGVD